MSHTTTIKSVQIRDLNALRKAVNALKERGVNCDLVSNARPRMYFERQEEICDHVLKLHDGRYDVGFRLQEDGSYAPIFDEYAQHVSNQIGGRCAIPQNSEERAVWAMGQLAQEYGKFAAIHAAEAQGYQVLSTTYDEKNNVQLELAVL